MKLRFPSLPEAVPLLVETAYHLKGSHRNLQMTGDPHYQPEELRPFLGYDQRVGWQIIVEFFWMIALADHGVMPRSQARFLTRGCLEKLLLSITTTQVTNLERKKTSHDILALLMLMRKHLPKPLHGWLHYCLTSYDVVSTAYALQYQQTFFRVFYEKARELDELWRGQIGATAKTLQIGRTHLQDALPITVGAWLAALHSRFIDTVQNACTLARKMPGKFSGAIGTKGAQEVLVRRPGIERAALKLLGFPKARQSTQITPPEGVQRFYNELFLVSGALANLGDDVRHLQASAIAEIVSASSSSSTMSHKGANPIAAENMDGMHVSVRGELMKVNSTLISTLQRDLRWSNVGRGFNSIFVFTFQQLKTAMRTLRTLSVNKERCRENFWQSGQLVVAELLHLSLQKEGYPGAHQLVNTRVVPAARMSGNDLVTEMDGIARRSRSQKLRSAWAEVPERVRFLIARPDRYLGNAISLARREAKRALKAS
jgi:adenylosuccinate lyase